MTKPNIGITIAFIIIHTLPVFSQDIHQAVQRGNLEEIQTILSKKSGLLDARNNDNLTPLHLASILGHRNIVEFLLSKGPDIDAKNTYGMTPLYFAVIRDKLETTSLLIEKGANVNIQNVWGSAPLHAVARTDRIKMVRLLIKNGAQVNIQDEYGEAPLHKAAESGQRRMVQCLLENGADVNITDNYGRTSLFTTAVMNDTALMSMLLHKEGNMHLEDKSGQTALHRAVIAGYQNASRLLIRAGAEINTKDNKNQTPLFYAEKYGHKNLAQWLKNQGAETERSKENYGFFPFSENIPEEGEAIIWYLGHSGWAVKTKHYLLIFDYYENRQPPTEPLLANGFINPDEIKDQNIIVFASHEHRDHYDETILKWEKSINDMTYIFGWKATENPDYIFMGPRIKKKIGDLVIESIHSPEAGELEGNFLVKVDGLVIYHSGDYSRGHDTFKKDMDYLAKAAPKIDIFFMLAGNPMDNEEALIALEKVQPRFMFPMHSGGSEYVYKAFAREAGKKQLKTKVICAENRGDRFRYRNGNKIIEAN